MKVRAILTDIEGTTSSIAFVHEVLFPYAEKALPEYVATYKDEEAIAAILDAARLAANEPDANSERLVEIMLGWIAADKKVTALKELQGRMWQHGYESADFTGHVYEEVADCLHNWAASGIDLYVYSSGSVGAQKLLFGYSDAGDLTGLFSGYFDTNVGHKKEQGSYRKIAEQIGVPAGQILFLSDIREELDAARAAGMRTTQLVRGADVVTGDHPVAGNFAEVQTDL